jgi:hypothetical protein
MASRIQNESKINEPKELLQQKKKSKKAKKQKSKKQKQKQKAIPFHSHTRITHSGNACV